MARPTKLDQLAELDDLLCDERLVHVDLVRAARHNLPVSDLLSRIADLFDALADPTRLRLVAALDGRELCVCDLAAVAGLSESATSHQLRTLRSLGLVRARREGRLVYYALDDEHVVGLYTLALAHAAHAGEIPA